MNPQYKVLISITLGHPIADKAIEMQLVQYLPFVPYDGQVVRLTSEDSETTLDLTLNDTVYDVTEHIFICSMSDDEQISTYSENGTCNLNDLVKQYQSFGFVRMNYPRAQAVRHEG